MNRLSKSSPVADPSDLVSAAQFTSLTGVDMKDSGKKALPRSKFSEEEDKLLQSLVEELGEKAWPAIASRMAGRHVRQCRERWNHYLNPAHTKRKWSPLEDRLLETCVAERGRSWKSFESMFPGRSDIDLKNHYNRLVRRRSRETRIMLSLSAGYADATTPVKAAAVAANLNDPAHPQEKFAFSDLLWSDNDSEGESGAEMWETDPL
jgi:hypothetical protein